MEPINFIFGGSLPSDYGTQLLEFDKNRTGVRLGPNLGRMIRDMRKSFKRVYKRLEIYLYVTIMLCLLAFSCNIYVFKRIRFTFDRVI